jgi:signal transduction histidine kinase
MKRLRLSKRILLSALGISLLTLLPLLAVLQYRWIGQLNQAERERMQANLRTASANFASEFNREMARACRSFQAGPPLFSERDWETLSARYRQWVETAPYPNLVRDIFVVEERTNGDLRLLRLDRKAYRFGPSEWPSGLLDLRGRWQAHFSGDRRGLPPFEWTVAPEIPALVLFVSRFSPDAGFPGGGSPGRSRFVASAGALIVVLDLDFIRQQFLPGLARKHFADAEGSAYQVAVVSKADPARFIWISEPAPVQRRFSSWDAAADLLALRPEDFLTLPVLAPAEGGGQGQGQAGTAVQTDVPARWMGGPGLRSIMRGTEAQWRLLVKHRSGSLEAVLASTRRRNLAISFGILFVLGAGVAVIITAARRAQTLARLQMQFVAGISHELLTPVAVIRSAAENLVDGVIETPQEVNHYGAVIEREGERLTDMIQQTLAFAAVQSKRSDFRPVDIAEVIHDALESCGPAVKEAEVDVALRIDSGVSAVMGDQTALIHCIRNLVANAAKYGGDGRWIGISAGKLSVKGREFVEIAVEDRGRGIPPQDLPHIFEPFYRGREVAGSRFHGTGLGLGLVKEIVENHRGKVSVKSALNRGSTFTILLPVASGNSAPQRGCAGENRPE